MRFSEYLSSFITPQMTLLEKFNALLKFLETHEFSEMENKPIAVNIFTNFVTGNINPETFEPNEIQEFKGTLCPLEIFDNDGGKAQINSQIQYETFNEETWYNQVIAVYKIGASDTGYVLLKSKKGKYYFWRRGL